MVYPKIPKFCGVATLMQAPIPEQGQLLTKADRMFAKLSAFLPVLQTEEGLKVGLLHNKAFSTKTGEPISYVDCRHRVSELGCKVNDRFIFTIRDGQLTLVQHLSRKIIQ